MNNIDLVKHVTNMLCENDNDLQVLDEYFDPNFTFDGNGSSGNLDDFSKKILEKKNSPEIKKNPNSCQFYCII